MITLNLLHPIEAVPIQTWKFESESLIRIGRSGDNDVILYSSVVSRYHVELHRQPLCWEVMNIGANGTFVEEQQIDKERIHNGMVIRLAATGQKLQILIDGAEALTPSPSEASAKSPNLERLSDGRPTFMAHK